MGLFDEIEGAVAGAAQGGDSGNIVGSLLGGAQGGGMSDVLQTLAANGLGEHVSSWMSNNPNLPVSPEQIQDALGSDKVQQMAASSGLPVGDFLKQLSQHLPAAAADQG